VRPNDWANYTVEQEDALLDWLDAYQRSVEDAEAKSKK